jgi:hemolysin TlyA family protein
MSKRRLDLALIEAYPNYSRVQISGWIMRGAARVNGVVIDKPGSQVSDKDIIELTIVEDPYVCRAGFKLAEALTHFNVNVQDFIVLDAGLSTGGFTDCLLQRGAQKIYGIDVGYGQVHEKIRQDPRVVVMERINLRYVENLPELVDLVTLDLSFISVLKVLPAIIKLMKPTAQLIVLIKPQFEAGKQDVGRGGIIKDPAVHERVVRDITAGIVQYGFTAMGVIESPILELREIKNF